MAQRSFPGFALLLLLGLCAVNVSADFFLHNPRGSNNRYRGDTNNQARLFDSQNNNNGGYGWGPIMTYYEGSILHIEYTATHGCGPLSGVNCEIVLQYMCGDEVRDGTRDDTPPSNIDSLPQVDQQDYGYHESVGYYRDCNNRQRNGGLFIADQNIGTNALNTRQNDGGTRRGFECDEERDYYPYWHPSPWKDIAILTSKTSRCSYYQSNSQNVVGKGHCVTPQHPGGNYVWGFGAAENNETGCNLAGNQWRVEPAWGIPPPECFAAPNLLDDTDNYEPQIYKWVIPSGMTSGRVNCVLRARYNISSGDYNGWRHIDQPGTPMIDSAFNGVTLISGDPTILLAPNLNVTLRVDTSQFGRTFQDRTHAFRVAPRPSNIPTGSKIWNMNVRGRRGNQVQAYPALQYGFSPSTLAIPLNDFVHFQWTGSIYNPGGQAGAGRDGTDRSNIVQTSGPGRSLPLPLEQQTMFPNATIAFQAAHLASIEQLPYCVNACDSQCCRTQAQMQEVEIGTATCATDRYAAIDQQIQNCALLNYQSEYFNLPPIQYTSRDVYYFMASRNTRFPVRSCRGTLMVGFTAPTGSGSSSPTSSQLTPSSDGSDSFFINGNLLSFVLAVVVLIMYL
eukprot:TRINITY_DN206_c0_g2_i1.p1 TRINITY_DN206_c0_g2~~TRINITY_DN206_c0_g2_i1.p1  ORF type:complete len:619 (+),score=85.22 TRINITY_DN206_c0_g2_i1:90-1946(+)